MHKINNLRSIAKTDDGGNRTIYFKKKTRPAVDIGVKKNGRSKAASNSSFLPNQEIIVGLSEHAL